MTEDIAERKKARKDTLFKTLEKSFSNGLLKRSKLRETGWQRSCSNLLRTSAHTHELEIKIFPYNSVPFGMSTVIFTSPYRSKSPSWKEKKVGKHTACDAFLALFLSHDNNKY